MNENMLNISSSPHFRQRLTTSGVMMNVVIALLPATIFGICTICINMIGDGLRDAVDPKSAER